MKLSKSTLVVPLAGVLLVGAAGAVAAASSGTEATSPSGIVAAAPSASPSTTSTTPAWPDRDGLLTEVLDDLVADGTITAAQQTAITEALDAARTARREAAEAEREQLRTFVEDGVITQEELDQLPDDSRLRQLTTLLDDGQITTDELRSLRGGFGGRGGRGHGFGGPLGPGWSSDDGAPSASPTTGS